MERWRERDGTGMSKRQKGKRQKWSSDGERPRRWGRDHGGRGETTEGSREGWGNKPKREQGDKP